jgi:two-component system chemotaxis sensor kinase CheA
MAMNKNDTLIQLVEQAACCVNMLGPSDLSDAQQLEDILSQIDHVVHELDRGLDPLRAELEGVTADATGTLKQILRKEVADTSSALDVVTKAICSLQGLVGKLDDPVTAAETGSTASGSSQQPVSVETNNEAEAASPAPQAMTISEEDAPLVVDFITEANEHIESAESALLELENHPDNDELINKIFRGFHTIKGMAGFLNLTEIGSLAHSAENLLDLARKGKLVLAAEYSDVVFASVDALKKMLARLKDCVESGAPVSTHEQLPQLLETLKAAAEGKLSEATPRPVQTKEDDEKLDGILADKAETKKAVSSSGSAGHAAADDKIKVSISRLDNLINMTGELVIAQLMVAEEINTGASSTHELGRKVAHQGKIVRELQELSMSMRMVPVQGVFQKMSRLARDLSRKADKQADFVTIGEETELDRTVVD